MVEENNINKGKLPTCTPNFHCTILTNTTWISMSKQGLTRIFNRSSVSSVGRSFDCRAGGCEFDSWGRTKPHGLEITEKWRYSLCNASEGPRKMTVQSPIGEGKTGRSPFNPKFRKFRLVHQMERIISVWSDRNIRDQLWGPSTLTGPVISVGRTKMSLSIWQNCCSQYRSFCSILLTTKITKHAVAWVASV